MDVFFFTQATIEVTFLSLKINCVKLCYYSSVAASVSHFFCLGVGEVSVHNSENCNIWCFGKCCRQWPRPVCVLVEKRSLAALAELGLMMD